MGAFVPNDRQRLHPCGFCLWTGIVPVGFSWAKKRLAGLRFAVTLFRAALCRGKRNLGDQLVVVFCEYFRFGDFGWTWVW